MFWTLAFNNFTQFSARNAYYGLQKRNSMFCGKFSDELNTMLVALDLKE
jgi:hypothetical protein